MKHFKSMIMNSKVLLFILVILCSFTTAAQWSFPSGGVTSTQLKVGIGTLQPNAPLSVYLNNVSTLQSWYSEAGASYLRIKPTDHNGQGWGMRFEAPHKGYNEENVNNNGFLSFASGAGTGIVINKNNNIGIGTNNPSQKLEIAGHLRINCANATLETGDNQSLVIKQNGTGNMHFDTHGNIYFRDQVGNNNAFYQSRKKAWKNEGSYFAKGRFIAGQILSDEWDQDNYNAYGLMVVHNRKSYLSGDVLIGDGILHPASKLDVRGSITGDRLILDAVDDPYNNNGGEGPEGGEIFFRGSNQGNTNYNNWVADVYENNFRFLINGTNTRMILQPGGVYIKNELTLEGDATSTPGVYESPSIRFNKPSSLGGGVMDMVYTGTNGLALEVGGNQFFSINQSNMSFQGKIWSKEVEVNVTGTVGDYVFDKKYKLRPLEEVRSFIEKYHHLPEVLSAKEIEDNGNKIPVGQMQLAQLVKIEELTLYILQQHDQLKKQQHEINELKEALKR